MKRLIDDFEFAPAIEARKLIFSQTRVSLTNQKFRLATLIQTHCPGLPSPRARYVYLYSCKVIKG